MLNKIITISVFLTVFLSSWVLFKSPFEGYITYIAMALLFPFYMVRYGVPRNTIIIFLPLLVSGFIFIQSGDNTIGQFLKIFIGFFSSVLFYRYVMQMYEFDVVKIFKYYLKGAYLVSVIGIFQIASFLVGFGPGYNFSWILNKWATVPGGIGIRLNSIFSEPAYFAAVIAPAFFVAIYGLIKNDSKWLKFHQTIIIIVAYFLTFSSLGILGIFVAVLLLLLNFGFFKYAIVFVPVFYFGFTQAYERIPEFRERYDGTINIFTLGDKGSYAVHGSSFVLYNNYVVATTNFKKNVLFGTGLGSHPVAFDKYSLTNMTGVIKIDFNKADANSMFLRLLSETGLYGTLFMIIFLIRNYIPKGRSANDEHWMISNAVLIVILLYLMRQGHYFLNGFPLFLWLYYYVRVKNQDARKLLEEAEEATLEENETPEIALN